MGVPTLVSGRVLDLQGKPIANAELDVWQTQTNGLYDAQDENPNELHMRGKFHTDSEGRYLHSHRAAGQLPNSLRRAGRRDAQGNRAGTRGGRLISISW